MKKRERVSIKDFIDKFPDAGLLFEFFIGKILIEKEEDNGKDYYWLTLETRFTRQYNIRINECEDGGVYFGAWSTDRLMHPFEDWHRGNDLTDGELNDTTITSFIEDVVRDLFVDAPKFNEKQPWKGVEVNLRDGDTSIISEK